MLVPILEALRLVSLVFRVLAVVSDLLHVFKLLFSELFVYVTRQLARDKIDKGFGLIYGVKLIVNIEIHATALEHLNVLSIISLLELLLKVINALCSPMELTEVRAPLNQEIVERQILAQVRLNIVLLLEDLDVGWAWVRLEVVINHEGVKLAVNSVCVELWVQVPEREIVETNRPRGVTLVKLHQIVVVLISLLAEKVQ